MNPVDRPLLDIGLTRLEFLRISGKGLAGLTIAPALLSLLGCKQEDIDSGTVGLINTPKGVLVTQRARCTGCQHPFGCIYQPYCAAINIFLFATQK